MFDTATPQGCYACNMLISAAEYEQDILSQRTNDGLTEGAEQGYYMIGGQKPFGWSRYKVGEHKKICVNEQERKVIHKMAAPVSYTHLDVYKRQGYGCTDLEDQTG